MAVDILDIIAIFSKFTGLRLELWPENVIYPGECFIWEEAYSAAFKRVTYVHVCVCAPLLTHVWLDYDPMVYITPGSLVPWNFKSRKLEWVSISTSRGCLPYAGMKPTFSASPALESGLLTFETPWKPECPVNMKEVYLV